jgi:quercetin dioxygenase-like cupin family protein
MCQCPHWGYVIAGRIRFVFADHEEVYEAGDAFYQPPGHRPYVDAGTELLQFSPTEELATTEQAVAEWMNAQQGAS